VAVVVLTKFHSAITARKHALQKLDVTGSSIVQRLALAWNRHIALASRTFMVVEPTEAD
jgi:hypothetical protein